MSSIGSIPVVILLSVTRTIIITRDIITIQSWCSSSRNLLRICEILSLYLSLSPPTLLLLLFLLPLSRTVSLSIYLQRPKLRDSSRALSPRLLFVSRWLAAAAPSTAIRIDYSLPKVRRGGGGGGCCSRIIQRRACGPASARTFLSLSLLYSLAFSRSISRQRFYYYFALQERDEASSENCPAVSRGLQRVYISFRLAPNMHDNYGNYRFAARLAHIFLLFDAYNSCIKFADR